MKGSRQSLKKSRKNADSIISVGHMAGRDLSFLAKMFLFSFTTQIVEKNYVQKGGNYVSASAFPLLVQKWSPLTPIVNGVTKKMQCIT